MAPDPTALDRIDRVLLTALQKDARTSNKALAARVGLAPSSCLMRVRRLERLGVIAGYRADLDAPALGLGLQALISVQLQRHAGEAFGSIGEHLRALPETVAVYCLGGATDFLVHVACRDTEHLRLLTQRAFLNRAEVGRIETALVYSYTHARLSVDAAAAEPAAPPTPPRRRRRRVERAR
jgi:DNA-binding Lrp family transcriptional regulator